MSSAELPKGYEPWDVEKKWQKYWEENKSFHPDPQDTGESYAIVIPPPNITGVLHMGHALNQTLQDILCRFYRQQGRNVLWIPGTDHAGIATQNVVERELKKEGKTRDDLGREKFIERVWKWREDKGGTILQQIRRMGASVDWERESFTLSKPLSEAVRKVFVRLYNDGLIYKGEYLINFCNRCHTALADDEVEHHERKGFLWHISYPLSDGTGKVTVATTRPETMLADTALAVNPKDERVNMLIGKQVTLPLVNRKIPIIGDNYVDMEFGTGCLKITPGHDHNDWELGRKHKLEIISILDSKGYINTNAPEKYQGLHKQEARERIVADLDALGLLEQVEEYENSVGECYRCHEVVEPHVSMQWFVAMKPLAEKARAAVPAQTKIYPEHWTKTYYDWLDNIRDWCISRQIWWGHRIPAWTCTQCQEIIVSEVDPTFCPKCASCALEQETDVLDTWFSSALWPFSTLGWPKDTEDLKRYYPTACLVSGFDILFFWVARMMMMGLHFMDEVPFKHVYIHALVRAEDGKKMSKSVGNVIDPVDMIEKYGTDALRFTLCSFAAMGRDIKLSEERIDGYRHFANKIWNAARFALMNLPEHMDADELQACSQSQDLANAWILHRLEEVKQEILKIVEEYRFNEMAQLLYKFIWNEFCDWYLEMIKPALHGQDEPKKKETQYVLRKVLGETLLLLHPIMPFISQEIWAALPATTNKNITTLSYPKSCPQAINQDVAKDMELFMGVVSAIRNIRTELGIDPATKLDLQIKTNNNNIETTETSVLQQHTELIGFLAKVRQIEFGQNISAPKASGTAVVQGHELYVPLTGKIDFDAELARLEKNLAKISKDFKAVEAKLANPNFLNNAPEEIVAKERKKLTKMKDEHEKMQNLKQRLSSVIN